MMYRGLYINLLRNERRRALLTQHLADIGIDDRYERFDAVDGQAVASAYDAPLSPGCMGIWLTHENIAQVHGQSDRHVHIIEDDTIFVRNAAKVMPDLLRYVDSQLPDWDLLFTDIHVPLSTEVFRLFLKKMQAYKQSRTYGFVDLVHIGFACASSLFVNRSSIAKYGSLIAGKWSVGWPIDTYIRHLVRQEQLKAYVVVPFLTSISPENVQSDIRGAVDASRRVCDLYRRAFFQEADVAALLTEMDELTRGAQAPALATLFARAEWYSFSDQWVPF